MFQIKSFDWTVFIDVLENNGFKGSLRGVIPTLTLEQYIPTALFFNFFASKKLHNMLFMSPMTIFGYV